MARGQIWQNFPKLLRFMALFPSLKLIPHCGIPCDTRVCSEKSPANGDARFWCRQLWGIVVYRRPTMGPFFIKKIPRFRACFPWNFQRFRKGVGGRGLATNRAPNTAKIDPQNCVPPFPKSGIGKMAQKRGLKLWHRKDLLVPTSSARQPLSKPLKFWCSEGHLSPCRKRSPAKGVWQKSDEKSDRIRSRPGKPKPEKVSS